MGVRKRTSGNDPMGMPDPQLTDQSTHVMALQENIGRLFDTIRELRDQVDKLEIFKDSIPAAVKSYVEYVQGDGILIEGNKRQKKISLDSLAGAARPGVIKSFVSGQLYLIDVYSYGVAGSVNLVDTEATVVNAIPDREIAAGTPVLVYGLFANGLECYTLGSNTPPVTAGVIASHAAGKIYLVNLYAEGRGADPTTLDAVVTINNVDATDTLPDGSEIFVWFMPTGHEGYSTGLTA